MTKTIEKLDKYFSNSDILNQYANLNENIKAVICQNIKNIEIKKV